MALLPGIGPDEFAVLESYDQMTRAARIASGSPAAPIIAGNLGQIARRYPGISPGVATAFAQAGQTADSPIVQSAWQAELAKNLDRTPGTVRKAPKRVKQQAKTHAKALERVRSLIEENRTVPLRPGDVAEVTPAMSPAEFKKLIETHPRTFAGLSRDDYEQVVGQNYTALVDQHSLLSNVTEPLSDLASHLPGPARTALGSGAAAVDPLGAQALPGFSDLQAGVRGAVRGATVGLQAGYEGLQGAMRTGWGTNPNAAPTFSDPLRPFSAVAEQTTAGVAIDQLVHGERVELGSGFLPNTTGSTAKKQAEAAREYSPYLVGGHAWTPGRAAASAVFEPDSDAFAISSGIVDASVALSKLDPASTLLRGTSELRAARQTLSNLTEAEYNAAGAYNGIRGLFAPRNWSEFKQGASWSKTRDALTKTSDPWDIWHATKGKIPIETSDGTLLLRRVAEAKTPEAVDEALAPYMGTEIKEVFGFGPIRTKPRPLEAIPGRTLTLGTDADMNYNAINADRALVNSRAPESARRDVFNLWAKAGTSRPKQYDALNATTRTIEEQLVSHGLDRAVAKKMTQRDLNIMDELINYGEDWAGDNLINPAFVTSGTGTHRVAHPLWDNQFINSKVNLPNATDIRRAVSGFGGYFNSDFNKVTVAAGDSFMQFWRKAVLMRPAWGVRVVAEEQARIAAYGYQSLYHHPMSFMAWVIGNPDDRWLNKFEDWGTRLTPSGRAETRASEVRGELDFLSSKPVLDPADETRIDQLTDELIPLEDRAQNAGNTTKRLRELKKRIGRGGTSKGGVPFGSPSDPSDAFMSGLYTRFSGLKNQNQVLLREFPMVNVGDDLYPQALIEEIARTRESKLGRAVVQDADPNVTKARFWGDTSATMEPDPAHPGFLRKKKGADLSDVRNFMGDNPGFEALKDTRGVADQQIDLLYERMNAIHAGGNPVLVDALRTGEFQGRDIMANGKIDKGFHDFLADEIAARPDLFPKKMRIRRVVTLDSDSHARHMAKIGQGVDWLFEALMPRPSNYLSRSPMFRQSYFAEGERLLPYMDETSRVKFLEDAHTARIGDDAITRLEAKHARLTQLGRNETTDAIKPLLDYDHMDQLAKSHALKETKDLLYDLSEKSQFMDAARLIFPFGEAWREIITRWSKLLWEKPQVFRRGTQVIMGARGAESDAINNALGGTDIGRPFFHKNQFGEEIVGLPGSELITKALVGSPIPLTGSVQGLNLVGSGLPGVGPVLQLPLAYLMPDKPSWDWFANIIQPFGDRTSGNPLVDIPAALVPGWVDKLATGLFKNPDSTRQYANAVFDAARYLQSTGDYDLQGADAAKEINRLLTDAKAQAKKLYMVRGIGQLFGPTPPTPEWLTHDKKGRMTLAWVASDQYQKDVDKLGYEAAYDKFLDRFGLNNFLLIQPKSKALIPAPPQTVDAGKWLRNNPDLAADYPHVYGLFAPTTHPDKFDQATYERQFERGERQQLTAGEMIRAANARLAQTAYNNIRDQFPDSLTDEQEEYLRGVRADITRDFPGYQDAAPDYGRTDRLVRELTDASDDPRIAKTDGGKALRKYLAKRDEAIASAKAGGFASPFKAQGTQPLREWLNEWGEYYVDQHPGFQPMWDLVFSNELGDVGTPTPEAPAQQQTGRQIQTATRSSSLKGAAPKGAQYSTTEAGPHKSPSAKQRVILELGEHDPTYDPRTGLVSLGGQFKGYFIGRDGKQVKTEIA